jgi:thiol-disulfide isomerase/thioredoxin
MTKGKILLIALLVGIFGLGIFIFAQRWLARGSDRPLWLPVDLVGEEDRLERVPRFRLPDATGEEIDSSSWTGKVLVLNFWATWCPPCLRELPLFDELQRTYSGDGLQIVGIAVDNKRDVDQLLMEHPVSFPILLGGTDAIEMSRRLGNRLQGLPFTAIFDHQGKRVHGQAGELTRATLSKLLDPLLTDVGGI